MDLSAWNQEIIRDYIIKPITIVMFVINLHKQLLISNQSTNLLPSLS
jgi:hypothetical protein